MTVTVHIDRNQVHQHVDGFGLCQAFRRAYLLRGSEGLPPVRCREVLDLLFAPDVGAGISILRLGIGSTTGEDPKEEGQMSSIAPSDPGGDVTSMAYRWDGDDNGQLWLAQQAVKYGVRRFYATAWSAPGYMMENGTDVGGGALRGLPGTSPTGGDWRYVYADYLLQYVRFYRQCGVDITDLGFANEPDILIRMPDHVLHYAHMRWEPPQVVDFVKVLGRAIERSGLPVSLASCDALSWDGAAAYTAAVEADPEAARYADIHTGHGYYTPARIPLPTDKPTWMSEWDPDVESHTGVWNDRWDSGRRCDGIGVAEDISDTFTDAGTSAYLYWFGVSTGPTRALIQADGADYHVSKRLWAIAAYSRFVRPGAHRVEVELSGPGPASGRAAQLKASAFQNANGETVVNMLNLATEAADVRLSVRPSGPSAARVWLTDEAHSLTPAGSRPTSTTIPLPARSLTTFVLEA